MRSPSEGLDDFPAPRHPANDEVSGGVERLSRSEKLVLAKSGRKEIAAAGAVSALQGELGSHGVRTLFVLTVEAGAVGQSFAGENGSRATQSPSTGSDNRRRGSRPLQEESGRGSRALVSSGISDLGEPRPLVISEAQDGMPVARKSLPGQELILRWVR